MIIQEDLYLLEDVFRVGNVFGPKLDHVREQDVTILHQANKTIVLPNTGGISAFNKIHPRLRGIWWKCPAGTAYPEELCIICDKEKAGLRHYSIQPAYPMELRAFQAILRQFAEKFEKIG